MRWTAMYWGERMLLFIKLDFSVYFYGFPCAVLCVPCGLLWRGNSCTIKLLGEEFGLRVQPSLAQPTPLQACNEGLFTFRAFGNAPKGVCCFRISFKLMPNTSLNQYTTEMKFPVGCEGSPSAASALTLGHRGKQQSASCHPLERVKFLFITSFS